MINYEMFVIILKLVKHQQYKYFDQNSNLKLKT